MKTKPARFASCIKCVGFWLVRLEVDGAGKTYDVKRVPADFGTGYTAREVGQDVVYHANTGIGEPSCECKSHLRRGHCKHVSGLRALEAAGKID